MDNELKWMHLFLQQKIRWTRVPKIELGTHLLLGKLLKCLEYWQQGAALKNT